MSSVSASTPASISQIVRESFNFTVDKFPLSGPDGIRTPWYALFRSDTNQPVGNGSVTARYVPHTTDDVVALYDAVDTAFDGVADVKCYFRDGHYFVAEPTRKQRLEIFGTDTVWPRVVISAPYDGKAFKASVATYRDMCRNLHIMRATGPATTVSIRHTRGLREHMDELIQQFSQLRSGWDSLVSTIRRMADNQVQMVDFLDQIYGRPDESSKRSVTEHKNRTEEIFKRLQREAAKTGQTIGADFKVNAWLAFNAVQGYVQHDVTRKGKNKGDSSSNLLLSLTDPKVYAAEALALAV